MPLSLSSSTVLSGGPSANHMEVRNLLLILALVQRYVRHRLHSLLGVFPHFVFLFTTLIYFTVQKVLSFSSLFV